MAGAAGRLTLDSMPFRGTVQVQGVDENAPETAVYVSDSANTATSMATGQLTSPSRIATTAGTDRDLITIMELAQDAGLGTGIVTTSSVTDATPASFVAHVNQRFCQGPRNMQMQFGQLEIDCASSEVSLGSASSALTTSTQSSACRW